MPKSQGAMEEMSHCLFKELICPTARGEGEREKGRECEGGRVRMRVKEGREGEKEKNWSIAEKDIVYEAAVVAHFNNFLLTR